MKLIRVKDKKPKLYDPVLLYNRSYKDFVGSHFCVGMLIRNMSGEPLIWKTGDDDVDAVFTHWTPLPEEENV